MTRSYHVPPKFGQPLTDQEKSILRDIANGKTREATAHRHFISASTLKGHLARASVKLGSDSTTHSITLAGLIPSTPSPAAEAIASYWIGKAPGTSSSRDRRFVRATDPHLARLLDDLVEELS